MSLPQTDYFDANLPGASQTVRIASLYDAKVFVCRWVIRDRDPALKALLRDMEKAKNFAMTESVIQQLTRALASRGLLVTPGSHISASSRSWAAYRATCCVIKDAASVTGVPCRVEPCPQLQRQTQYA